MSCDCASGHGEEWIALVDERPAVGDWVDLLSPDSIVEGPFCWSNGLLDSLGKGYTAWRPS